MKKTFLIIIAVLVAGLLILGGIYLRLKQGDSEPLNSGFPPDNSLPTGNGGSRREGGDGTEELPLKHDLLSEAEAIDVHILPSGEVQYVRTDGQIVRLNSTSSTLLSTSKVSDILDARFSFDGKKVLVKAGAPLSPRWSAFDIEKNSWRQIPIEAKDAYWAPGSQQIAYFARRISSSDLSTLDLGSSNSKPKIHLTLNAEDLDIYWASNSRIFFSERGSAIVPSSLWRFDISKGSLALEQDGIYGISMIWGSDKEGILFKGRPTGRGGSLYLIDENGSDLQLFSLLTLPSKCAFGRTSSSSAEKIICAVPKDPRVFSSGALPDDYNKGAITSTDDIYIISPVDDSLQKIASNLNVDAVRLILSGNDLYFIDRITKKINRLQIGG